MSGPMRRRAALRGLAGGAAALLAPLPGAAAQAPAGPEPWPRVVRDGMAYRRLGRTGLMVSEIVLGGSPLADESLVRRLIDRGVNYIDTSDSYENGNCERKVGRLFNAVGRDKLHVHARFHLQGPWTAASLAASVEGSLRRLATDHVDVLGIHGVESPDIVDDPRIQDAFRKLEGKYASRGLTCHVNAAAVIPKAVACGLYDMVQVGYNVFDLQPGESPVKAYPDYLGESGLGRTIDLCRSKDVGVIGMKVLKVGGQRQVLDRWRTEGGSPQAAMIKWALSNPRLTAVVIEILNGREMEEDLGALGSAPTPAERKMLAAHIVENRRSYCHLCGSCRAACPAGRPLSEMARGLMYAESYGKMSRALEVLTAAAAAGLPACRGCGTCEAACPYGLPVREAARRAERLLGKI